MKKQQITDKPRASGLYNILIERIAKCEKVKGEIIRFPIIFESICRGFSITKKEAWEILFILRDFDVIEISRFHGVRLK